MTRSPITYQLQLPVMASNKVQVPGCEPPSSLSSSTLSRTACVAVVDLDTVLNNIPGTYIVLMANSGRTTGAKQRYLVFPPIEVSCPCGGYTDYYKLLRELATTEEVEESSLAECSTIQSYSCVPDFSEHVAPAPSPYQQEGDSTFGTTSILTLPPVWNGGA